MGLSRFLLLLLLALIAWYIWRQVQRFYLSIEESSSSSAGKPPQTVTMLQCDYCGLHFPKQEVVKEGRRNFCCEEHRMAALKRER